MRRQCECPPRLAVRGRKPRSKLHLRDATGGRIRRVRVERAGLLAAAPRDVLLAWLIATCSCMNCKLRTKLEPTRLGPALRHPRTAAAEPMAVRPTGREEGRRAAAWRGPFLQAGRRSKPVTNGEVSRIRTPVGSASWQRRRRTAGDSRRARGCGRAGQVGGRETSSQGMRRCAAIDHVRWRESCRNPRPTLPLSVRFSHTPLCWGRSTAGSLGERDAR